MCKTHSLWPLQLKHKVYLAQQRATLCTRVADEATDARGEAEKHRALAEARAHSLRQDRELTEADRSQLSEDLLKLKKQVSKDTQEHRHSLSLRLITVL